MSREQYRARSKKVQKLGRDGLVEQDKATGQEKRISQRTADISFGPDRAPEQGAVRPAPSHGKKRRQQPRPSPPPEADQSDAPDMAQTAVPDVSSMADPSPAVRGADDAPAKVPAASAQDVDRSKKRRHRRQIEKLRREDEPEDGRLQFEPGHDFPPDTIDSEESEAEPTAAYGSENVPVRGKSPGGSVPPPAPRRTRGGRLRFEPERDATPNAFDTRKRRGPEDAAPPPAASV